MRRFWFTFSAFSVFLIITVAVVSDSTARAQAQFFSDVPSGHAHYDAIQYLAERGYVSGYPGTGMFLPERLVNRAETAAMIVRALNANAHPAVYRNCFSDVRDEWFAAPVCYGESNLWWQGYPGSTLFRPEAGVIAAEAVRMILEAYNVMLVAPLGNLLQKWDVPQGRRNLGPSVLPPDAPLWWYTYFLTARMNDYVDSTPPGDKPMTRGEIAEIVYRIVLDKRGLWVPSYALQPDVPPRDGTQEDTQTGTQSDSQPDRQPESGSQTDTQQYDGPQQGTQDQTVAGSCSLGIEKPLRNPDEFQPVAFCSYANPNNHDTQLWIGQAYLPVVWGQPYDFAIADPEWAMSVAFAAERFNINPNYLLSVAIKESRMNCAVNGDGCYQFTSPAFAEVKQQYPAHVDAADDHSVALSFTNATVLAGLYFEFTDYLYNRWYGWSNFLAQAADPEAKAKIVARAYNRGLWDNNIKTILNTNSLQCRAEADLFACYDANTVALDHGEAIMRYCNALGSSGDIYDARLTWQQVEAFLRDAIDATYAEGEVDIEAMIGHAEAVFACLQDEGGTISFRYDFKTTLKQIMPMLPAPQSPQAANYPAP